MLCRLLEYLFDGNVEDVFVVGLGFDCAVGRTARDAATFGFNTFVVEDATCWFDDRWHNEMVLELFDAHVSVISYDDILKHHQESSFVLVDMATVAELTERSKQAFRKRPTDKFVRRQRKVPVQSEA